MEEGTTLELGFVVAVSGSRATVRLYARRAVGDGDDARVAVGKLVALGTPTSLIIGVVSQVSGPDIEIASFQRSDFSAEIDFLGEIVGYGTSEAHFQRGVSEYPSVGDRMFNLQTSDLALIHRIASGETIVVGHLKLDEAVPAYINFDEMLRKHFAILGTTGVGKSSAVALVLREILKKDTNLKVLLVDPHNEYRHCFGDSAQVLDPNNLQLPFWLFNLEEIVEVFFRGQPDVGREIEVLSELIPIAKARFAASERGQTVTLRQAAASTFTPDTPVPYLVSDLLELLNDRLGRLDNKSSVAVYQRIIARIESLGRDSRYSFMFGEHFVEDVMTLILEDLFQLTRSDQSITVMELAGFPAEVVDCVVSVLCRVAFELCVWSDGALPLLVACEEAHRYAPSNPNLGFGPTRKALSRIAKEGRKYSAFLGVITQRPADLDPAILSQCSTVFAMRMANDRDQEIVKAAVPDAGSSLVGVISSLGNREAIAFGEGVPLPTRIRFGNVPEQFLPFSQSEGRIRLDVAGGVDNGFVETVVSRWRETNKRPTTSRGSRPGIKTGLVELTSDRAR